MILNIVGIVSSLFFVILFVYTCFTCKKKEDRQTVEESKKDKTEAFIIHRNEEEEIEPPSYNEITYQEIIIV
tara:strand:+ start:491 stop:706 length:216 start_codon:yes stop_codon:yes gene_type:complete